MAPKLPKMCVLDLKKNDFLPKNTKKITKTISENMEASILDTARYCESVRGLGFQEYRQLIFSGLIMKYD